MTTVTAQAVVAMNLIAKLIFLDEDQRSGIIGAGEEKEEEQYGEEEFQVEVSGFWGLGFGVWGLGFGLISSVI